MSRGSEAELRTLEQQLTDVLGSLPPLAFDLEAPFPGRSPGLQRVDALVPASALVVEADGRTWHTRLEDFERDRRRDAEAAAAGFQTLRFTYDQLVDEPRWVRRIVLETGARRTVELRGAEGHTGTAQAPNRRAA